MAHRWQAWLWWWPVDFFSPLRGCETAMLKEGIGDHCHEGMTVKAMPGSSLEVIETEFLFQLLMGLFTNPARLDGAGECFDRLVDGQVREVVFALSAGPTFSDQPGLVAGHVLAAHIANALRRPVCDPHPHSGEASRPTRPLVPWRQCGYEPAYQCQALWLAGSPQEWW